MKWAGIALMVVGILIVVIVWSWATQAAIEHSERAPMDGQLAEAIYCFGGSVVGLITFVLGGGLLGSWFVAERRR